MRDGFTLGGVQPYSEMNMELKNSIDHVIGTHVFLMTVCNDEVVVGMPKKPVVLV